MCSDLKLMGVFTYIFFKFQIHEIMSYIQYDRRFYSENILLHAYKCCDNWKHPIVKVDLAMEQFHTCRMYYLYVAQFLFCCNFSYACIYFLFVFHI